jgi:transposase
LFYGGFRLNEWAGELHNFTMAAYSIGFRKRIVDAIERGVGTRSEVAKLFGVHETFVYKSLRQKRERGHITPLPYGGGAHAKLNEDQLMALSACPRPDLDRERYRPARQCVVSLLDADDQSD